MGPAPGRANVSGGTRTAWASQEQQMVCGGRHLVVPVQIARREAMYIAAGAPASL